MASDLRTEMPHGPQRSTHSTDGDAGPLTPILSTETSSTAKSRWQTRWGMHAYARRTLGMFLLFVTVCLWTLSNFLASSIFADGSYNKPFFLTYANSSIYAFALIPMTVRYATKNGFVGLKRDAARLMREHKEARRLDTGHIEASHRGADRERLLGDAQVTGVVDSSDEPLSFRETMVLSMNFAIPWIAANYFAAACFEYTSVASGTIFLSTSSMWTLILGALSQIERLSVGKVAGVLASLVGVGLVASVDLSGESDENRGSFPHKSPGQIILGNAMAAFSAVIYGYYVTTLKKRVGNEDRVNMQLFFGLIGVWTLVFMWPVFVVLHFTKIETFAFPTTSNIWTLIIVNSLASFVSDISWAFAMLLTTPLIVTVGLSLNIPLAVVGQVFQYSQYSSLMYWVGAIVVVLSFVLITHESKIDDPVRQDDAGAEGSPASPP